MDREPRIGDRYRWYKPGRWIWAYVVEFTGNKDEWLIVEGKNVGSTYGFVSYKNLQWKYLGNFSKSSNFSNLYSILNEETID